MAKRVVTHHAHHPGEGVYRLIHAQTEEVVQHVEVENPNYDPVMAALEIPEGYDPVAHTSNGNGRVNAFNAEPPTLLQERKVTIYSDHQDIIWADDDEQWQGLSDDEIAAKQRQQVKEAFDARRQEALKAEQAARDFRDIGQTEVEL